jgi:hypothetical protein
VVVATTCGELAGFTIPAVIGATATSVGVGQSASRATAAGAAAAWTIGMLPSTLNAQLLELWSPMLVALGAVAGMVLLASIGFAQWLVLRRHVDGSGIWVAANALAWIAG